MKPIQEVFKILEEKGLKLNKFSAVELFGGKGLMHSKYVADAVGEMTVWDNSESQKQDLETNIPKARVKICNSYMQLKTETEKFDLISCDNPIGTNFMNEHFEIFPDMFNIMKNEAVVIIDTIPEINCYCKQRYINTGTQLHLDNRRKFYKTSNPKKINHEKMKMTYRRIAQQKGFETEFDFFVERGNIIHYYIAKYKRINDTHISNAYVKLINYLQQKGYLFTTCREYYKAENLPDKYVAIRHDVDNSIEKAFNMATWEYIHNIRSTYFILHTASYFAYSNQIENKFLSRINDLLMMQNQFGHEIGLHNNLMALETLNINAVVELENILKIFRMNDINIYGTSPHGGYIAHKYKFNNIYFWGFPAKKNATHPNDTIIAGRKVHKTELCNHGIEYEANLFSADLYWFDNSKIDIYDYIESQNPKRIVMLIHPIHWSKGGKHDK